MYSKQIFSLIRRNYLLYILMSSSFAPIIGRTVRIMRNLNKIIAYKSLKHRQEWQTWEIGILYNLLVAPICVTSKYYAQVVKTLRITHFVNLLKWFFIMGMVGFLVKVCCIFCIWRCSRHSKLLPHWKRNDKK